MAQLNDQEKCDQHIENQTTLGLWYHNCHTSCRFSWHDKGPDYTHFLSSMNDPDHPSDLIIYRLDLLKNSDGDVSKHPTGKQDIPATVEQVENYLNLLEKEWDGEFFWSNPKDALDSLPPGYKLMYRPRGTKNNRPGDLYLWGHPSGLWFSSASRFSFHLAWLINRGKKGSCQCKPCDGVRG
ncbi:hypothetical protein D6D05_02245 [Aureobasidium pullulans]|nr:hypothetical protein D6D05_02245 [Aureobasidium pullulans]